MEKPLRGYLERVGISPVCDLLVKGKIAVLPTDTIYGFHCLAANLEAVAKIRVIKRNRNKRGFILIFSDLEMMDGWVSWRKDASREILSRIWPAPFTAILPAAKSVKPEIKYGGAVAVRIPVKRELRSIIGKAGCPLISTSVNISGENPLTRISDIVSAFPGLSAYISRKGRTPGLPSTLADFRISPPEVVRAGAYNFHSK